ncbi:chorismate mutase [Nitzschia inconspicua]|uniref:Chorismate mutase n=1 Tax=Nitzschia inconspicua TaxID=303405 RepID=A0A9K3KIP9_9STRA|nr:chorismate mutase [Nitzschia inconspicua]
MSSSPSSSGNHNNNQQQPSSSCHAFPIRPWNSRLINTQQQQPSTPARRITQSSTSSLASTTEDASRTTSVNGSSISNNSNNSSTSGIPRNSASFKNLKTSEVLSLDSIRASLIRQEETIIFALIERAQFRHNAIVYEKGGLGHLGTPPGSTAADPDEKLSFLEYMLVGTEALHFAVRRYTSPEEHAFFPERLPTSDKVLEELEFPRLLSDVGHASDVNFNEILLKKYVQEVVPSICQGGDDEQHGSTALCDVAVLQALSKRVHYGKFVAESKYLADPEGYQKLVDAGDAEGVMKLLTNEIVEAKVLRRARLKAATYGTEPLLAELPPLRAEGGEKTSIVAAAAASAVVAAIEAMGDDDTTEKKVCPATVESIYRDLIIPLTKDVEVAYLFRRCGREPPPEYAPNRMSTDPW